MSLRIRKPPETSRTPAPSIARVILPPVLGRRPWIPSVMPPREAPLPEPPLEPSMPEPPLPGNETLALNVASSKSVFVPKCLITVNGSPGSGPL